MNKASLIPAGTSLVGEVEGDADLIVMGRVEGPIHVSGALVIESTGLVRGHVRARTVTVRGVLKGDAYGEEAIRVERSARLIGELTAPRVKVVPGAAFRGQIHVGQVGEPRLQIYDPSLHTLTGQPAPIEPPSAHEAESHSAPHAPSESELESVSLEGATIPVPPRVPQLDPVALPPVEIDELEDEAPTLSEMRPTLPFIPKDEKKPTFELKMPTLGRKRGRRRAEV